MTLRNGSMIKLGVGAALLVGMAASASAQVTSDRRVPVTKDARGGDVVVRVDTVYQYRTDTMRVFRTDTLRTTVTRYDTTRIETMPGWVNRVGGLYFGLGLGGSHPHGALSRGNATGYSAQAQLGVQPLGSPLGFRVDANYAQFGEIENYAGLGADPDVINGNANLVLKIPMFRGRFPNFSIYATGGGSYSTFKDLRIEQNPGTTSALNNVVISNKWSDRWGWNAGGGAALQWGRTELFLESRVIQFTQTNTPNSRQIPFILGVNWY
jgi:hypothetical protein